VLFGWKASKNGNFDTQVIDIRRTFRLSTNLGELIKVNHWAKVANKQQILMYKTAVYTLVNCVIIHQKQQISKR